MLVFATEVLGHRRPTTFLTEVLSPALFSGGWAFLLPYAALYLSGLAVGARAGPMRGAFWLLHAVLLLLFAPFAFARLRERFKSLRGLLSDAGFWYWTALGLAFLAPGVYLEYPSDPWDHFARINSWRADQPVSEAPVKWRWGYLLGWSVLSLVEPAQQRSALTLFAAFWQLLLALQLVRLAGRLGLSGAWARVVVFGAIALFGNNLFSFFRYYALASTAPAYVAYLRALIAVLDLGEGQRPTRSWLVLGTTIVLMAFNHAQEVLLLTVSAGAVIVAYRTRPDRGRGLGSMAVLGAALAAALALGWLLLSRASSIGLRAPSDFYPFMSRFGSFRLWDPSLSYFHTLGIHGWAAVGAGLLMWRKQRVLAALTLAPVFLLLFPPFAYPFAHVTSIRNTYRVLYALPDSFMLAATLRALPAGWLPAGRWGAERSRQLLTLAVFAIMGLVPSTPFFGKLAFQVHVPGPMLGLEPVDRAAQWLSENRRLPEGCSVTSDSATEFALAAFRGVESYVVRVSGQRWLNGGRLAEWRVQGADDLLDYRLEHRVCGYLVFDEARFDAAFPPPPSSWAGPSSGHWPARVADLPANQVPGLPEAANALMERGWSRTPVPPFYWYFEPPRVE